MKTERKLIFIRPRRGSALEELQADRREQLPHLVHDWAETFKTMLAESDEGEKT